MIASAIGPIDREEDVFFASGVSNSLEIDPKAFQREEDLLNEAIHKNAISIGILHYFSTTGLETLAPKSRPYFHHKRRMEEKLVERVPAHKLRIYRLPNVVGHSNNPHTLTNFIYRTIQCGEFDALNLEARRELLDIAEVQRRVVRLRSSEEVLIRLTGIKCTVGEIVDAMCSNDVKSAALQHVLSKYYSLPIELGTEQHNTANV